MEFKSFSFDFPPQPKTYIVPPPVSTDTYNTTARKATPMPTIQSNRRSMDNYRYQTKGPPRKALPCISGSNSQPTTPDPQHNLSFNNGAHSPMPLPMSKTSPVDGNKLKVKNSMKKSVSADSVHDYDPHKAPKPPPQQHSSHPHHAQIRQQQSAPQYKEHRPHSHRHSTQHNEANTHNTQHRPSSHRHSKEHKRRHKHKHRHKKKRVKDKDKDKAKPKLTRAHSDRNPPSIGTMKQLIERAETFGVKDSPVSNNTQRTTTQAPQIPANNSIFDNTESYDNGNDRIFEVIDYNDEIKEDLMVHDGRYMQQEIQHSASLYLPLKNYESSPINANAMYMGKAHRQGISTMNNQDMQIKKLRKEIDELCVILDAKRTLLERLEKDKLQKSIERLKPITLLKRLNTFCDVANGKELKLIEQILRHRID